MANDCGCDSCKRWGVQHWAPVHPQVSTKRFQSILRDLSTETKLGAYLRKQISQQKESPVKYVQHISGQGAKWPVIEETGVRFIVKSPSSEYMDDMQLPKSEYQLCAPPEPVKVWKDVTGECGIQNGGKVLDLRTDQGQYNFGLISIPRDWPLRLKKVQLWELEAQKTYRLKTALLIEQEQ